MAPVWVSARRCREGAPAIGEEPERAGGGDGWVELAQRAGGGVAGVGEGLEAGGLLTGVEGGEIGVAHIDLAADFEELRGAGQGLGDVVDGAGVGGDVLAGLAVAAGGGADQLAVLVAQREREAVDLGLGGVGERGLGVEAEETADADVEIGDLVIVEGIGKAQHRHVVAHLAEGLGGGGADLAGGAVGALEMREAGLDGGVAALEGVVGGVGDLGRVGAVIGGIGGGDLAGEHRKLGFGLGFGEGIDIGARGHGLGSGGGGERDLALRGRGRQGAGSGRNRLYASRMHPVRMPYVQSRRRADRARCSPARAACAAAAARNGFLDPRNIG